jgi:hypothetical protein
MTSCLLPYPNCKNIDVESSMNLILDTTLRKLYWSVITQETFMCDLAQWEYNKWLAIVYENDDEAMRDTHMAYAIKAIYWFGWARHHFLELKYRIHWCGVCNCSYFKDIIMIWLMSMHEVLLPTCPCVLI